MFLQGNQSTETPFLFNCVNSLGGLGEAVMTALTDQTNIKIVHFGIQEVARRSKQVELFSKYGIDAEHIDTAVEKLI